MPTGITAPIYDGKDVSMKDYLLRCARHMGPYSQYRDEPEDLVITPKSPDSLEEMDMVSQWEKMLSELNSMTEAQLEDAAVQEYNKQMDGVNSTIAESKALFERYSKMLEEIKGWEPPTEDHIPLKEHAISQLESSISHDCIHLDYESGTISLPEKKTAQAYLESRREYTLRSKGYEVREAEAARSRNEFSYNYITKLNESLGIVSSTGVSRKTGSAGV